MPEPDNVYLTVVVVHPVHDTVRADDDLPKGRITILRHDSSHLREIRKTFGAAKQKLAEDNGPIR